MKHDARKGKRSTLLVSVLMCTLFFCGGLGAQDMSGIRQVSTDPANQVVTWQMTNGVIVTADNITQRIYVQVPTGQIHEVTFAQAAAAHTDDPAAQQNLISNLRSILVDQPVATLTPSTSPRLASGGGTPPGGGGTERPNSGIQWDVPEGTPGPCDLGPCTPYKQQPWGGRYTYMWDGGSPGSGDRSVQHQQCRAMHFEQWKMQRDGACQSTQNSAITTAVGALGAAAACSNAGNVARSGGRVCAAAIAATAVAFGVTMRQLKQCQTPYPGADQVCQE